MAIFSKDEFIQLQNLWDKRSDERVQISFSDTKADHYILTAANDWGVIRNRGRRGACYSPKAIINQLKLLSRKELQSSIGVIDLLGKEQDESFDELQVREQKNLSSIFKTHFEQVKSFIHLGGGHDHIYPLLMSLDEITNKKIIVLNLDAHLDTRVDPIFHSGTPFRQFDHLAKKDFLLLQLGIHQFANPKSNYTELKNGNMKIVSKEELEQNIETVLKKYLPELISNPHDYIVVLSLDADAINTASMEAVSAPNHAGLSIETCRDIILSLKKLDCAPKIFGIYEYNPIYDNANNKGARSLVYLINHFLK